MLLSELYSGICGSSAGWKSAGFSAEWSVESDQVARNICKHNGIPCRSSIPLLFKPVDFAVFYCGASNFRMGVALRHVEIEQPPAFLIESDKKVLDFPGDYDIATFSLNAAKYFFPHARIKEYCFGIKKERNPNGLSALEEFVDAIETPSRDTPIPFNTITGDDQTLILPPLNKAQRAVHSPLRPLPEVHNKSGKVIKAYGGHVSDASDFSRASIITNELLSRMCGITHIQKPAAVSRVQWFKWVGNCLDPCLAELIGSQVMDLLNSGLVETKRKRVVLGDDFNSKACNRRSKLELLVCENLDLSESCEILGVTLELGPPIKVLYTQGTTEKGDEIFSYIAGSPLPVGAKTIIKQRINQQSKLEDIHWEINGKSLKTRSSFLRI